METTVDTSFISNMPAGPLDTYRNRVKFDWKQLRLILEDANSLKIKYKVWNTLERDPLFARPQSALSSDKQKRRAALQLNRVTEYEFAPPEVYTASVHHKVRYLMSINEALYAICPNLSIKIALGVGLFTNALTAMGSERHLPIYRQAWNREVSVLYK
jgi:acyl-CoA oxidase